MASTAKPRLPPPPTGQDLTSWEWRDWFFKLSQYAQYVGGLIPISTLTPQGTADQVLGMTHSGTLTPEWKTITPGANISVTGGSGTITLAVTATLPVTVGGTGITSYTTGDLLYASNATTLSKLADVAAGPFLRAGGVGVAPLWSTTTLPNSATTGDLLYASSANTYSNLADIATGNALLSGGVSTAPSWGKVSLTTAVSGTLQAAQFPALTGDITTSAGALATTLATVNSNVGSFGSATQVGTFTVNGKGLVTAASNVTISGVAPGGSAGGDLSGTYPSPTVAKINTVALGTTTATAGNLLIGSGSAWVTNAMSGDATLASTGVLTLATVIVGKGGTGATTLASNGILYGNGTSAIQALAVNSTATTKFLTQVSSGAPAWNTIAAANLPTITLTSDVTGAASGGSITTTVAAIAGTIVSGVTGTTNVVFSASPILTGSPIINASTGRLTINGTSDSVSPLLISRNSASVTSIDSGLGLFNAASDTGSAGFQFASWGGNTNFCQAYMAGGTAASPAITPATSNFMSLSALGYNGSAYTGSKAVLSFQSVNAWSLTDNSTKMLFRVTPTGTTALKTTLQLIDGSTVPGPGVALSTTATDGFLYLPGGSGAPTGVPTTRTGAVALYYDTGTNNFYAYNGAWVKTTLT